MTKPRLPAGIAAEVHYARADGLAAVMQIQEPRDPFEVCNAAGRRLLPEAKFRDPDPTFDALMRARAISPVVQPPKE